MKNNNRNKTLVCGIIILFLGASIVQGISSNNEKVSKSKNIDNFNREYLMINSTSINMHNEKGDLFRNPKGEYIDQEQTLEAGAGLNINYGQYVAQSFKPSVPRLSKVYLKLFKYNGVPTYDLEFYVREGLSSSNLVTVTKTGSEVINGWNEFEFPDLQVQVEQTYYLVCEGDGGQGSNPIYCWYYSDTNPYNRGMVHIFSYGSWHSVPDSDCCFQTVYTNDPPNQPSNPDPYNGETNVNINTDLSWTGSDPDPGDILTYDIYFEADDPTPDVLVSDDQTETTYDPGTMELNTIYYWQIIAEDNYGASTPGTVWHFTTTSKLEPDLECTGDLSWTKVKPGFLVSKDIYVENIGASGSLLDWEITEWPDWGNWTFTPIEGYDLTPEDGQVTVHVFVKAPDEGGKQFSGHVTVVNTENASDFEILDVSLSTPVTLQSIFSRNIQLLQNIIHRFPLLERILGLFPVFNRISSLR